MAVKFIAPTDTLEKFRTEFNDLSANQFGDIANLSGAISANNIVDAMNETISIATSTAGWTIEDSSSTQQIIGGGNILRVFGTSNEIEAVVSATDTLTIGLPNAVSVTTSVTAPTLSTGNMSLAIIDSVIASVEPVVITVPSSLGKVIVLLTVGSTTVNVVVTPSLVVPSNNRFLLVLRYKLASIIKTFWTAPPVWEDVM